MHFLHIASPLQLPFLEGVPDSKRTSSLTCPSDTLIKDDLTALTCFDSAGHVIASVDGYIHLSTFRHIPTGRCARRRARQVRCRGRLPAASLHFAAQAGGARHSPETTAKRERVF